MRKNDPYRDWTPADRSDAWRRGNKGECERYDRDRDSSERAYEEWLKGGGFRDPQPDNRFS